MNDTNISHYPIFLDLKNRPVTVIGGGRVAERKVGTLLKAGAEITVISPDFTPMLIRCGEDHEIKRIQRVYREGDLQNAELVFSATNQPKVNIAVAAEAKSRKIWINVADRSATCDFLVPAIFVDEGFTIAVGSGGLSPSMSVKIRNRIKAFLTNEPVIKDDAKQ